MESHRYDYLPIIRRRELKWPKGARIALWVGPNIECFHIDRVITGDGGDRKDRGGTHREPGPVPKRAQDPGSHQVSTAQLAPIRQN